jgi:transposase
MRKRKVSTFQRLQSGGLNRRQRRKLERQLTAADPGLAIVHPHAGGIDVGNESHFAAVPPDRDSNPVQEFGCWTADLIRMAKWLQQCRIETVAVQATGVYWIAVYDVLTQHGIRVTLVNAQHTRNLPGRKSDVQECQWLMKLHTYGLLRDSFHLDETVQNVRTIWRLRDRHVKEASQAIQHMQKALTKMNVQLANVISDVSGVSGQAIIGAILNGERDPYKLADLKHERVQASREEVAHSLEGNWRQDLLFELRQAVQSYEFAHWQMSQCDRQLESYLANLPTRSQTAEEQTEPPRAAATSPARRSAKPKGNAPAFDIRAELRRIAGVDLTTIEGINVMTAQTILAEVGADLSAFSSEDHFAAWLGLSPSKDISGGKVIGRARRKVKNRVAQALRMAATTLRNSKSYLGARYRHLRHRFEDSKAGAVKAMARHLAVLVYRLLRYGQAWVDQGEARFEQKQAQRELAWLTARAQARGLKLVPAAARLQ